jgi:peptidoglycan/LPS O-acetylase OafA/YrhL
VAAVIFLAPALLFVLGGHRDALWKVVFMLAWLPALLFFLAHPIPATAVQQDFIETAGNVTYASDLLHFPLQLSTVLVLHSLGAPVPTSSVGFFMLYLFGTLTLATLTYRWFEMPVQNWLRQRLA